MPARLKKTLAAKAEVYWKKVSMCRLPRRRQRNGENQERGGKGGVAHDLPARQREASAPKKAKKGERHQRQVILGIDFPAGASCQPPSRRDSRADNERQQRRRARDGETSVVIFSLSVQIKYALMTGISGMYENNSLWRVNRNKSMSGRPKQTAKRIVSTASQFNCRRRISRESTAD